MTQPDALALADELCKPLPGFLEPTRLERAAGNELRRLHESNTELLWFVKAFVNMIEKHGSIEGSEKTVAAIARAAIAKAERTTP